MNGFRTCSSFIVADTQPDHTRTDRANPRRGSKTHPSSLSLTPLSRADESDEDSQAEIVLSVVSRRYSTFSWQLIATGGALGVDEDEATGVGVRYEPDPCSLRLTP